MILQDEYIRCIIEYAPNQLFVTVSPTCMFLIDDWIKIKCIHDPNSSNTEKNFSFLFPNFDLEDFPFIAVCGKANLSLFNVRDCTF